MKRTAINIYRPRALLVLFAAAVLAAMALLGVMADSSGAAAGDTTRVSVDSSGTQGNKRSSGGTFSADGRYVAFSSSASNLVTDDTNTFRDAFVRDRQSGTTERVSVSSSETQVYGSSSAFSISADGRYVAFNSSAPKLVTGDTNGVWDLFVRDRQSGTTERVSVTNSGAQGNDHSVGISMSADGRYIAFRSHASNLVEGDTNGTPDLFVRDRQSGTTERVNMPNSEAQSGNFTDVSLSDDGRYVAFSTKDALVGDTNDKPDVYVLDRDTGTPERVSVPNEELPNPFGSNDPHLGSRNARISADGRYVAFASVAQYLVAGDTNGGDDAFVLDRDTGTTERVSVDSSGKERENTRSFPLYGLWMSADGSSVGFGTYDRILVPGDDYSSLDVFVHDRDTGKTERVNVSSSGAPAEFWGVSNIAPNLSLSADGRYSAFTHDATNLVSGDTNGVTDVFVHERRYTTQQTSEKDPPTATASATTTDSGAAYDESGTWTDEDVEETLSALDNQEGGSGAKETTYSATGAQQIASTTAPSQTFAPAQDFLEGTNPGSVTSADFDGDGKADLATSHSRSHSVSVLLGKGDGSFQDAQTFRVDYVPVSVATADFNGDEKADLVTSNLGFDSVSVLLGNGDGTFQDVQHFPVGTWPASVTSGHFNDDGEVDFVDLAVANAEDDNVSILLGNGDGTFQDTHNVEVRNGPVFITSADLDGDNKADDLATANNPFQQPDGISVLLGNDDGTFQPAQNLAAGLNPKEVIAADFDGDERVDGLVVANFGSCFTAGTVLMLLSNGDGTFQAPQDITPEREFFPWYSTVTAADFDRDGKEDLAVTTDNCAGSRTQVVVLIGNGDGSYYYSQEVSVGVHPESIINADLNADSYADLAVANRGSGGSVSVLLNIPGPPHTSIDSGPTGTVASRSASFSFSSSDASASFECRLDSTSDSDWSACSSPKDYDNLSDGSHTFEVRATTTDPAGNPNPDPNPPSRTWTVDTTAPSVPVITSPPNNSYDTDGNFTVFGTAEANSTIQLLEGTASRGTATVNASGEWSIDLSSVTDGSHSYKAKAADAVGNTSSESEALTVIVDKSPPTLDSVEPDNGATGVSRDVTPEATFSDAMNPATLTTSVKLYQRKSGKWRRVSDTKVSCDDSCTTVTIDPYPSDPSKLLAANKRFKVTVTTGAKNLAGLPLSSSKSWTFTTGG